MGSIHTASCKCGFKTKVVVGGAMNTFHEDSRFPFYCEQCGLVEPNIAKFIGQSMPSSIQNETKDAPICPKCGSVDIHQYGKPPTSVISGEQRGTLQAWGFKTNAEGNLCPACKQMTLTFNGVHILFD